MTTSGFRMLFAFILASVFAPLAHALQIPQSAWTVSTVNDANASVDVSNNVSLRVFKTSWAEAIADLGSLGGQLQVDFSWRLATEEGWYEHPYFGILTGGVASPADCVVTLGRDPITCPDVVALTLHEMSLSPYSTTVGTFSRVFDVDEATKLVFGLVPSNPWSTMPDHFNTYFDITDLSLRYVAHVPEPEALGLIVVGLLGISAFRRKQAGQM